MPGRFHELGVAAPPLCQRLERFLSTPQCLGDHMGFGQIICMYSDSLSPPNPMPTTRRARPAAPLVDRSRHRCAVAEVETVRPSAQAATFLTYRFTASTSPSQGGGEDTRLLAVQRGVASHAFRSAARAHRETCKMRAPSLAIWPHLSPAF